MKTSNEIRDGQLQLRSCRGFSLELKWILVEIEWSWNGTLEFMGESSSEVQQKWSGAVVFLQVDLMS